MTRFRRFLQALRKICLTTGEKIAYHPISGVIKEEDIRLELGMDEKQFFQSAEQIRLLPHEKVAIKEAILHFDQPVSWWALRFKTFTSVMSAFLIVSLVGGGVSYAAENTVPGDFLYAIKLHVNERVMTSMANTDDAKAMVETELASRRLAEAETLMGRNALDESKERLIKDAVQSHLSTVRTRMSKLREEKNVEQLKNLSVAVDRTLRERSMSMRKMATERAPEPLLAAVRQERVHAQMMELSAAMNDESAPLPLPTVTVAAQAVEHAQAPVMMMAKVQESTDDVEEMQLAAEARVLLAKEQMETIDTDEEVSADTEKESDDDREDDESGESEGKNILPVMMMQAMDMTDEVEVIKPLPLSPKEMLRDAERQLREGNAPEAARTATSVLEKVREMKKGHSGKMENMRPAALEEPKEEEKDYEEILKGSVDGGTRLQ